MKYLEVKLAFLLISLIADSCLARRDDDDDDGKEQGRETTQATRLGQYPGAVLVTEEGSEMVCGGFLVTLAFVATTCSCIARFDDTLQRTVMFDPTMNKKKVFAGVVDFQKTPNPQFRRGVAFMIHPYCSKLDGFVRYDMDLGAIRLEKSFDPQQGNIGSISLKEYPDWYATFLEWNKMEDEKKDAFVVHYTKDHSCTPETLPCKLIAVRVHIVGGYNCRITLCPGGGENATKGFLTAQEAKRCDKNWYENAGMVCGFKKNAPNKRSPSCEAIPGSPVFTSKGVFIGMTLNNELCDTPYYITRWDQMQDFFNKMKELGSCASEVYVGPKAEPSESHRICASNQFIFLVFIFFLGIIS